MGLLLDTGFIQGLRDVDDPNHEQAEHIFDSLNWIAFKPIVTTSLIVNECYTLMSTRSQGNKLLLQNLDTLFWGTDNFFSIIALDLDDFQKISKLLAQYTNPKKLLSFADASLIYISQLLKIKDIISFDKHFDGILTRVNLSL